MQNLESEIKFLAMSRLYFTNAGWSKARSSGGPQLRYLTDVMIYFINNQIIIKK